jgi:two-component sensor histidine kinase
MRPPDLLVGFDGGNSELRESNHRIANNLMTVATLLRHQCRQLIGKRESFGAAEVREILDDASQRIEMVGRLHRRMAEPISPDMLNLSPYLNDVAETAIDALSAPGEVELAPISGDMCPVHASQALLIGLLVGDLVARVVKISRGAGARHRVKLTCERRDGGLEIGVANEGVALPEGHDTDGEVGGLVVAKLLAVQLKATFTFQTGAGGLVARLFVPVRAGPDLAELDVAGEA